MRQQLKVRAVIFDMDGVITNTMPDHYNAWKTVLKKEDIKVTYHDIYKREGQKGIDSVKEIFEKYGQPCVYKKARQILAQKEREFKRIAKTRFIVGTRSFLKKLHSTGFQLALVTGTARHELHEILPDCLYNLFSVIITGSDVQDGKPHPEPYLTAIKKLGISTTEAVVIENAPFGIKSAKLAGLKCFAVETSLPREFLKEADRIFLSIKELQQKIQFVLMLR